ncbi:hypothetical protein Psfp_04293 [Pelotomaculum sp. FP]|nr:hypothetical protein Psfp_04293 [Pelotomaculum sp. FP]
MEVRVQVLAVGVKLHIFVKAGAHVEHDGTFHLAIHGHRVNRLSHVASLGYLPDVYTPGLGVHIHFVDLAAEAKCGRVADVGALNPVAGDDVNAFAPRRREVSNRT